MDRTDKTAIFEKIYTTHVQEIFRYTHLKVGNEEAAKDITASTFLKLWQRLANSETIVNARALVYVIARGLVVDYYRSHARRQSVPIDGVDEALLTDSYNFVNALDDQLAYEAVLQGITHLKETYQEVVLLHYVEGLPVPDIALVLNESENNIRVRVHRALLALKEQLAVYL